MWRGYAHRVLLAVLTLAACAAPAETIDRAHYAQPVTRYGHFALGKPHEYAQLVVTSDAQRRRVFVLATDEVFEDLAPRIVRLAAHAAPMALTIISHRTRGARIALFALHDDTLRIAAQSPPIGQSRRWLNPVAVADLDGDGHAEIAAVITPHIGGVLKVYRRRGDRLMEIAVLPGFSNHIFGLSELGLSTAVSVDGRTRLLVPDVTRLNLRIIALQPSGIVEVGRCRLAEPLEHPIAHPAPNTALIRDSRGDSAVDLRGCLDR